MEREPLDREAFQRALRRAPQMKENFYTVLSEPGAIEALLGIADNDPELKRMLR